jgi:hypothetical protein
LTIRRAAADGLRFRTIAAGAGSLAVLVAVVLMLWPPEPGDEVFTAGRDDSDGETIGWVSKVEANTIHVNSGPFGGGVVPLVVTRSTRIRSGAKEGWFEDIRPGGQVKVAYKLHEGRRFARSVDLLVEEGPRRPVRALPQLKSAAGAPAPAERAKATSAPVPPAPAPEARQAPTANTAATPAAKPWSVGPAPGPISPDIKAAAPPPPVAAPASPAHTPAAPAAAPAPAAPVVAEKPAPVSTSTVPPAAPVPVVARPSEVRPAPRVETAPVSIRPEPVEGTPAPPAAAAPRPAAPARPAPAPRSQPSGSDAADGSAAVDWLLQGRRQ